MPTKSIVIETTELCFYGCGNRARYKNASSLKMCDSSSNKCPAIRQKNSIGVFKAHKEGRIPGWNKLASEYNIDRCWSKGKTAYTDARVKSKYNPETLFTYGAESGPHKQVLLEERGHQCQKCLNTEWLGKPITIELEHIDGDNLNNVKENLQLLCPNCHSQTTTWRRRKTKGCRLKYSREEYINSIISSPNMNRCLRKLNLSWGSGGTILKIMQEENLNFTAD